MKNSAKTFANRRNILGFLPDWTPIEQNNYGITLRQITLFKKFIYISKNLKYTVQSEFSVFVIIIRKKMKFEHIKNLA
jgi:hypothetical protein